MGRKIDAFLGRNFKTAKFKALVNLAISRIAVLRNQRQARCSIARSDIVKLLDIGHHERALLRIEQVIKEQNMLDVFDMTEGYLNLLIERVHLIEQQRECPREMREAVSSLLFAASRCGEFPELQEIRAVLTSRFGKDLAAQAVELRNNCGVNHKMVQKLSTRMPGLENRMKVLKEIASENSIVLQLEQLSTADQSQPDQGPSTSSGGSKLGEHKQMPEVIEKAEESSDSMKTRKTYRDVADAAQAAFESAAYAAEAARAAVELSRSGHSPDDQDSPDTRRVKTFQIFNSESAELEVDKENQTEEAKQDERGRLSTSSISSNAEEVTVNEASQDEQLQDDIVFDQRENPVHNLNSAKEVTMISDDHAMDAEKTSFIPGKDVHEEETEMLIDVEKKPISVRTKRVWGL